MKKEKRKNEVSHLAMVILSAWAKSLPYGLPPVGAQALGAHW